MEMMRCANIALVLLCAALCCTLHSTQAKFFDDSSMEVRKRFVTPSCRKCLFRPDDWISCQNCYGRPGLVPYYGFNKRSQLDSLENESSQPSYESEEYDDAGLTAVEKRASFLTCRCCISLAARKCCDKCSLTPYYGKRSYETSFFGWDNYGRGDCSCCDSDTYNYSCCSANCSRRKRK